jgi:hypothetical protein
VALVFVVVVALLFEMLLNEEASMVLDVEELVVDDEFAGRELFDGVANELPLLLVLLFNVMLAKLFIFVLFVELRQDEFVILVTPPPLPLPLVKIEFEIELLTTLPLALTPPTAQLLLVLLLGAEAVGA